MRILLIAPDQPGINAIPEIRAISSLGRVTVLNGPVSAQDIEVLVRYNKFDVVHFATHGDETVQTLSNGEVVKAEDAVRIARMCGAKLMFFNSCRSGMIAVYLTRHGIPYAIHTNIELPDVDAWKMPSAFYDYLQSEKAGGREPNFVEAYKQADSGDGVYGLSMALDMEHLLDPWLTQSKHNALEIDELRKEIKAMARTQLYMLIALAIAALGVIAIASGAHF